MSIRRVAASFTAAVLAAGALSTAVALPAQASGGSTGGGQSGTGGGGIGGDQSAYKCEEYGIVTEWGEPYTLPDGCGSTTNTVLTCVTGALIFNFYGTAAKPAESVSLSRVNTRSWNSCLDEYQVANRGAVETFYFPPTSPGSEPSKLGADKGLPAPYTATRADFGVTKVEEMDSRAYRGYPQYLVRSWAGNVKLDSERKTDQFFGSISFPEIQGEAYAKLGQSCQVASNKSYDNYWVYRLNTYRTGDSIRSDYKDSVSQVVGEDLDVKFIQYLAQKVIAYSANEESSVLRRAVGEATLATIGLDADAARLIRRNLVQYVNDDGSGPRQQARLEGDQVRRILNRMLAGVGYKNGLPQGAIRNPIEGSAAREVLRTLFDTNSYVTNVPCYSGAQFVAVLPEELNEGGASFNRQARKRWVVRNSNDYPLTAVGVVLLSRPAFINRKSNGSTGLEFRTFQAGFGERLLGDRDYRSGDLRANGTSRVNRFATCEGADARPTNLDLAGSTADLSVSILRNALDSYCASAQRLFTESALETGLFQQTNVAKNPAQMVPGPFMRKVGEAYPRWAQEYPKAEGAEAFVEERNIIETAARDLVSASGMRVFVTNFVAEIPPTVCEGEDCEVTREQAQQPEAPAGLTTVAVQSPRPYRVGGKLRPETVTVSTTLPPRTTNFTYDIEVVPPSGYKPCTEAQAQVDSSCDFTYQVQHSGGAVRTGSNVTFEFFRATPVGQNVEVRVVNARGRYTVTIPPGEREVCRIVEPTPSPTPDRARRPAEQVEPEEPREVCETEIIPARDESRSIQPTASIWTPSAGAYLPMTPVPGSSNSWLFNSPVLGATDNP